MKTVPITGMSGGKTAAVRELAARGHEPLLRRSADHEIGTRRPVAETVDEILRLT